MLQKGYFRELLRPKVGLLFVGLMLGLAGCGTAATPTPTAVPTPAPTATAGAPATEPTATAEPVQEPTETPLPPGGASDNEWRQVGLAGNEVGDIKIFQGRDIIVLAAGPSGAWRSTYDYTEWEPLDVKPEGLRMSVAIGGPDVMYIAGGAGCLSDLPASMFGTTDGGKTWRKASVEQPVAVAAADPDVAYAANCMGVMKTTDSGASWVALPNSRPDDYDPLSLAASHDGRLVYATYASEGGSGRVMGSADGGGTWTEITPKGGPEAQITAPVNLTYVPGTAGSADGGGLYMTTDQGFWYMPTGANDWKLFKKDDPMLDNPGAVGDYRITALYVDAGYIYTARAVIVDGQRRGAGVYSTTNQGMTWEQVGDQGLGQRVVNSLTQASYVSEVSGEGATTLLAGTDDGVWAMPFR